METQVCSSPDELGREAATFGADAIREGKRQYGSSNIVLATGASQLATLDALIDESVDWSVVEAFHLDEYVGMSADHPASFRRYLRERFVSQVGNLRAFHEISGDSRPEAEVRRINELIGGRQIDVAFVGIGENGHLAFNDPPADFDDVHPYLIVDLDQACRQQQVGEGWFGSLAEVPKRAISMSISQILRARRIVVSVPDLRKARAVKCAIDGPVDPQCPASILQRHPDCTVFLDQQSASLLGR